MAESYADPNKGSAAAVSRDLRVWVLGLLASATLAIAMGLVLAGMTPGVAPVAAGAGLVVAMGLALVVGASKTSSA
jgi:hypothetical protein